MWAYQIREDDIVGCEPCGSVEVAERRHQEAWDEVPYEAPDENIILWVVVSKSKKFRNVFIK